MSQKNVEIVRAAYDAWNRGDMPAVREMYNPDAMLVRPLEGWPEAGLLVGREAVIENFEQLRATWDSEEHATDRCHRRWR